MDSLGLWAEHDTEISGRRHRGSGSSEMEGAVVARGSVETL